MARELAKHRPLLLLPPPFPKDCLLPKVRPYIRFICVEISVSDSTPCSLKAIHKGSTELN